MLKITKWLEGQMPSSKPSKKENNKPCLDTMQVEALKQLQEGRQFMTSAMDAICAKYHNEQKAR
jgi:hypothetical protein